jgi:prolyl-tRNA synthetase
MGGSASVEFMSPTEAGEDLVVHCAACRYAANMEKAAAALPAVEDPEGPAAPEPFDTPQARTIEELTIRHGVPADRQIKTLVYVLDGRLTLVLMRGDHTLVEQKLIDAAAATAVRPATPEEIKEALGASPGSLGAVGVEGLTVWADEALRGRRSMTTGANRDGVHLSGVDVARDIPATGWADFREISAGEPCADCGEPLQVVRTVEVGHIFKLGYKYTEALDITVLGPDGGRIRPIMGSYGIGVERAIAAVVEAHHDEKGIVWPDEVAPYAAHLVAIGANRDEAVRAAADGLHELAATSARDILYDDRDESPGVKFTDAELLGMPWILTVSPRSLAAGGIEVTRRETGDRATRPIADVEAFLRTGTFPA